MLRFAIFALLAVAAGGAAAAQNVVAKKEIGPWTVDCAVDRMTDKTSCHLWLFMRDARGEPRAALVWAGPTDPPAVWAAPPLTARGAMFRFDRNAALGPFDACSANPSVCLAPQLAADGILLQVHAPAQYVLLRVKGPVGDTDFEIALSDTAEAWRVFRRLSLAAAGHADPDRAIVDGAQHAQDVERAWQGCDALAVERGAKCRFAVRACKQASGNSPSGFASCLAARPY